MPKAGRAVSTLRDAGEHVAALPKEEAALQHWQVAAKCLLSAVEGSAPVMMARIAMIQALGHGNEAVVAPRRKPAKK